MAKGLDKHRERLEALALFGKDLTRRAGSKCELCETAGVKLQIHEVPPVLLSVFGSSACCQVESRALLISRFGHDFKASQAKQLAAVTEFLEHRSQG